MTAPTDYKALAEEVLALAKHVSWEACFGPGKYAIHAEKENCHKLFWGVDELARAVLALDKENQRLRAALDWHVANDNSVGANHAREALERKP